MEVVLTELEDDCFRADELLADDEDLDMLDFEADLDGDLSRLGALTEADFSVVLTDDDSDLARRAGSDGHEFGSQPSGSVRDCQ